MTTQPEALRLLEKFFKNGEWTTADQILAAAELRRLHEEKERLRNAANCGGHMAVAWGEIKRLHALNQELLEALKDIATTCSTAVGAGQYLTLSAIEKAARAAIAKAEGRA